MSEDERKYALGRNYNDDDEREEECDRLRDQFEAEIGDAVTTLADGGVGGFHLHDEIPREEEASYETWTKTKKYITRLRTALRHVRPMLNDSFNTFGVLNHLDDVETPRMQARLSDETFELIDVLTYDAKDIGHMLHLREYDPDSDLVTDPQWNGDLHSKVTQRPQMDPDVSVWRPPQALAADHPQLTRHWISCKQIENWVKGTYNVLVVITSKINEEYVESLDLTEEELCQGEYHEDEDEDEDHDERLAEFSAQLSEQYLLDREGDDNDSVASSSIHTG